LYHCNTLTTTNHSVNFSIPKTVNLTLFHSKITSNVRLDLSQLFT